MDMVNVQGLIIQLHFAKTLSKIMAIGWQIGFDSVRVRIAQMQPNSKVAAAAAVHRVV